MPKTVKRRRNTYMLGSILIVAFLFSYYLFTYIPDREEKINQRGIRIMNRVVDGIDERLEHYKKSVQNFACDYAIANIREIDTSYPSAASASAQLNYLDKIDRKFHLSCNNGTKALKKLKETRKEKINTKDRRRDYLGSPSSFDTIGFDNNEMLQSFFRSLKVDPALELLKEDDLAYGVLLENTIISDNYLGLGISYQNLLESSERYDFFEDFILVNPETGEVLDHSKIALKYFEYEPESEKQTSTGEEAIDKVIQKEIEKIRKHEKTDIYHIPSVDLTKTLINEQEYYCYTTLVEIEKEQFYLTGLISSKKYNENVRQVSIWVILIVLLVLLFLIQFLPIIKPFILSKKERLQAIDVIWAALALVFGISVFSLIIIGFDTFTIEEIDLVEEKLTIHANAISGDLNNEINQLEEELRTNSIQKSIEDLYNFTWDVDDAIWYLEESSVVSPPLDSSDADTIDLEILNLYDHPDSALNIVKEFAERLAFITQLANSSFLSINSSGSAEYFRYNPTLKSWIDSANEHVNKLNFPLTYEGMIKDTVQMEQLYKAIFILDNIYFLDEEEDYVEIIDENLNVAHRNYYRKMLGLSPVDAWNYRSNPYYLESLFSMSNGEYTSVLAVQGADGKIEAIDVELESVNNRYLEPNYFFSIIDRQGTIHYHSNQDLIKNENFLEEADMNEKLISFLHNEAASDIGIRFSMKDYLAYVKPIPNTPWFVVTGYNVRKSRLNITQSMATTFQIVIFLLIYLVILNLFLRSNKNRKDLVNRSGFKFLFLNPVNTSPRVFAFLAVFNLVLTLLLVGFYQLNSINLQLNITAFFSLITLGILISYVILNKYSLSKVNLDNIGQSKAISSFEVVLIVLWALWFFVFITTESSLSGYVYTIALLQVLMLVGYIMIKIQSPFQTFFLSIRSKMGYTPFFVHSFTWVCMLGVLSAFLFFKPIYNMQHIKRSVNNWMIEYKDLNESNQTNGISHKTTYFKPSEGFNQESLRTMDGNELFNASIFIDGISLYFDEDEKELFGQGFSENPILISECEDEYGMPFFNVNVTKERNQTKASIPLPNYVVAFDLPSIDHQEKPAKALVFWLIIILSLVGLYLTIKALSQRFFYLNLLNRMRAVSKQIDSSLSIKERGPIIPNGQLNVMLIGPPYAGRNQFAKRILEGFGEPEYIDFLNEMDDEKGKISLEMVNKPIIINNFDYRIFDFNHNKQKLAVLEKIIQLRNQYQIKQRLILISNFDTNQLIEVYKSEIDEKLKKAEVDDTELKEMKNVVYRWESILFGFTAHVVQLQHTSDSDYISNELNFGSGLVNLEPQIRYYEKKLKEQDDWLSESDIRNQIIEAIMDMAQNYYFAIWNACSREEKFLLYDMAQDGLINSKNERVVVNLVRKGILLTEPTLRLFNLSFTRFVLENISEEEGLQMEKEAKKEGVWGTYQFLVIFLIIVIVVFLAFVEKEAINKMTGIITIGGAMLPKIVQFVSKAGNPTTFFKKTPS